MVIRSRILSYMLPVSLLVLAACLGSGNDNGEEAKLHAALEEACIRYADPNSPERDEAHFIAILENLLASPDLASADSVKAASLLSLAMRNRPGNVATDFTFESADGTFGTLHGIVARYLLLIFYDPECPHCSDILEMVNTPITDSRIADGSLSLLAVYTEGNDSVWRATVPQMPANWTIAIDRDSIVARDLYDIPAMPVLYLLDSDKRVILKDTSAATLASHLM